jgi:hypothetical protein
MVADSENGDIIVLSFPYFFFNNNAGWGWGSGIGVKHRPLSCFLLAGGVVWGKILRLLWYPGRDPHNSLLDGFGEVDILGGTTG